MRKSEGTIQTLEFGMRKLESLNCGLQISDCGEDVRYQKTGAVEQT